MLEPLAISFPFASVVMEVVVTDPSGLVTLFSLVFAAGSDEELVIEDVPEAGAVVAGNANAKAKNDNMIMYMALLLFICFH